MHSIRRSVTFTRALALAGLSLLAFAPRARAQTALSFYPLTPCRVWDTRTTHPPQMTANASRDFVVRGRCGVPNGAQAVAINVTIVGPTEAGNLRIYQAGLLTPPLASLLNWAANDNPVANGTIVPLADSGGNNVTVRIDMPTGSTGRVHTLADVTGYFQ